MITNIFSKYKKPDHLLGKSLFHFFDCQTMATFEKRTFLKCPKWIYKRQMENMKI
jgi:hypothetical protein